MHRLERLIRLGGLCIRVNLPEKWRMGAGDRNCDRQLEDLKSLHAVSWSLQIFRQHANSISIGWNSKVTASKFRIPVMRNVLEFSGIFAWWLLLLWFGSGESRVGNWLTPTVVVCFALLGCWCKTVLFGMENIRQLFDAAKLNLSHHRFLILMAINMSQMITAFALDFHVLYFINPSCFAGVAENVSSFEAVFDFFYLSTLNFSFFGYSDILPQTIPAKIVNLTEIVLAFVTVIFILSDFMSLKESIASPKQNSPSDGTSNPV